MESRCSSKVATPPLPSTPLLFIFFFPESFQSASSCAGTLGYTALCDFASQPLLQAIYRATLVPPLVDGSFYLGQVARYEGDAHTFLLIFCFPRRLLPFLWFLFSLFPRQSNMQSADGCPRPDSHLSLVPEQTRTLEKSCARTNVPSSCPYEAPPSIHCFVLVQCKQGGRGELSPAVLEFHLQKLCARQIPRKCKKNFFFLVLMQYVKVLDPNKRWRSLYNAHSCIARAQCAQKL